MPKAKQPVKVSPNNPCPFLRALVQHELLEDDLNAIGDVANTIVSVAKTGEGNPVLPSIAIRAIAVVANGLGPLAVAKSGLSGLSLNSLRNGPLDKKGAGSRILDSHAVVKKTELERLKVFASDKKASDGTVELGLDHADLSKMMDENFARAKGHRRRIDRRLMDGEWPVLLKVMGKDGEAGRYLSFDDVRTLFVDRKLPQRMVRQIES